jgi:hypothetical protein
MLDSFSTPAAYQAFLYNLPEQYPSIQRANLVYVPTGKKYGRVEGMIFFAQNIVLCVQEFLNFELNVIEDYGYEVTQSHNPPDAPDFPETRDYCKASYPYKDKLYWYDSFPHPHIPELASTHPHHKHIHPDIKHNRVPAPELSFTRPNLPFLIAEIEIYLAQEAKS